MTFKNAGWEKLFFDTTIAFSVALLLTFATFVAAVILKLPVPGELEIAAVFTSYASTWLCVVQSRSNYYWGFVSVILYSIVFYQSGLLASMGTNLYLCIALIYGWLRWGPDADTRPVRVTPLRLYPIYLAVTVVGWYGAVLITQWLGGQMAFLDSMILALTILAQFLLDNKRIETWVVWVGVNVIAIYLYLDAGLYLVVFQYVLFLLNTLLGGYAWYTTMRKDVVNV